MVLRKWDKLPESMKNDAVRPYYEKLKKQTVSLVLKRTFDIVVSFIMLLLLSPVMLVLAIMIKLDTPGPVFFRQERITTYGESFRIFKFRTMTHNAGGPAITRDNDNRITKVGKKIRDLRLDELPQLIDVLCGKMTFVGTRPEAPKFVDVYTDEMKATLLMPAGITCIASILFKDERELMKDEEDTDKAYVEIVLPQKMKCCFWEIKHFSILNDIKTMFLTVFSVLGMCEKKTEALKNDILS